MATDLIVTERLELVPLTVRMLEALLCGDRRGAELLLGATIPEEWPGEDPWIPRRMEQLREDPALEPWLLRAMVVREKSIMVGQTGFHTRPGPEYLKEWAPGGVEFGYTVFENWRRQGYAREAVAALMAWAQERHGIERFVITISPENVPSLALARSLGFHRIGSHLDDEDGQEDVYERRVGQ